jgi:hypothetical protein
LPPAAQTSSEDPPYFRRQAQSHRTVVRGSVSTTRVMEHRHGLPVDIEVTEANGFAERDAALTMLDRLPRRQRRNSWPTSPMTSPSSWPAHDALRVSILGADVDFGLGEVIAATRSGQLKPNGWWPIRTTRPR